MHLADSELGLGVPGLGAPTPAAQSPRVWRSRATYRNRAGVGSQGDAPVIR